MAKRILPQVPPGRKTQRQATPAENPKQTIRELGEKRDEIRQQIRNLECEEIRLELQRAIAQGIVDPLPEITLSPEETQAVSEHLYWSEGLVSTMRDAVSTLRGAMEIVQNKAEELGLGGPKGKYGQVDLWNSYNPLHGAVETLALLSHRLIAISDRAEAAEWKLPDRLRETKKAAEELHASDFGE
jgi:hypothetical protein